MMATNSRRTRKFVDRERLLCEMKEKFARKSKQKSKFYVNSEPYVKKIIPEYFHGRYNRPVGAAASIFRIKYIDGKWWPVLTMSDDDSKFLCPAVECQAAYDLAEAVNRAKWEMTSSEGGAFLVDEFSQILVPNSDGNGERMIVGELHGVLDFVDSGTGKIFNLNNDENLNIGDLWAYPYVGVQCHLSRAGQIYSFIENDDEKTCVYPNIIDEELVQVLTHIRDWRGCRFIVNPHGIVLTKKKFAKYDWRPIYAGRIDYNKWYDK
jgi:hypothetical protein